MDFYKDLESFIEAYLYFDGSPLEILHTASEFDKKSDPFDEDLDDIDQLVQRELIGQVQEPLPPLPCTVVLEITKLQPTNSTDKTACHNFEYNLKDNCTKVKTICEHSCSLCRFQDSDLREMRHHQLSFHAFTTSNDFSGYLNHVTHASRT